MNLFNAFLSGGTMMASLMAAIYFLRFWRKTHDRFFAFFALAFAVLAINRLLVAIFNGSNEVNGLLFYSVRLCAFLLILIAIVDKNRSTSRSRP